MPFPSTASATTQSLEDALQQLTALAGAVKQRTTGLLAHINAGPVDGGVLVNYLRDLTQLRASLVAQRSSTPGLLAYAKTQYGNDGLDIQAEFVAMRDALDATRDWFGANLPKNAQNYLLVEQIAANGNLTYRTFTQAQLVTLVELLTALSSKID